MGYQHFCMKPSEQGSFFWASSKWVQIVVCYDQNLQKHKYLSGISMFLHETFRTGLIFLSRSKWVQIVVCYDQNLQKHKYLSAGYQHFCMKPSEQGSFFWVSNSGFCMKPSEQGSFFWAGQNRGMLWSKWVQIVVCYDWNLQKHKYLSGISMFLHETFRTGLIFLRVSLKLTNSESK